MGWNRVVNSAWVVSRKYRVAASFGPDRIFFASATGHILQAPFEHRRGGRYRLLRRLAHGGHKLIGQLLLSDRPQRLFHRMSFMPHLDPSVAGLHPSFARDARPGASTMGSTPRVW